MITVVLVEPMFGTNVGSVCRSMKNFGLHELVIINPKCDLQSMETVMWSKHAVDILKKAKVVKSFSYLDSFDYKVATTSQIGSDYNIPRVPITSRQFAERITGKKASIALIFGREGEGLFNHEIEKCDFVVTIPSSREYPVLNLAQAATVMFYDLYVASGKDTINSHIKEATNVEFKQMMKMLNSVLGKLKFTKVEKKETQRKVWKRIFTKSFMSKREAYAVMGLLSKLQKK